MTPSDAQDPPTPEQREREALIDEIEETREQLGATVEALAQKADVKAALALIPITKPVYKQYRAVVEAEYPHLKV